MPAYERLQLLGLRTLQKRNSANNLKFEGNLKIVFREKKFSRISREPLSGNFAGTNFREFRECHIFMNSREENVATKICDFKVIVGEYLDLTAFRKQEPHIQLDDKIQGQ